MGRVLQRSLTLIHNEIQAEPLVKSQYHSAIETDSTMEAFRNIT